MTAQDAQTRGFVHDRLTEAADGDVDAVRNKLYACPCGRGVWISVRTGEIYQGHGGNEREQWELQRDAPWILLEPERVYRDLQSDLVMQRAQAINREEALRAAVEKALRGPE